MLKVHILFVEISCRAKWYSHMAGQEVRPCRTIYHLHLLYLFQMIVQDKKTGLSETLWEVNSEVRSTRLPRHTG